jgi:hypothetical protein|tara:strand:- start:6352 stop:6990 length:639 start_codon:yes stop_codon:yes gene_type:complete
MNLFLKFKTLILSYLINSINGDNYHNISKFYNIYKIWNNIRLDSISGDYIEFGIFKGKALLHSYKTYKKLFNSQEGINFYGLDSFEGFPEDNHDFYIENNFSVSYKKVLSQFKDFENIEIHKGYFKDVLTTHEFEKKKFSFVFIDCDIYESALDVFNYIQNRISKGGFIMIDDFTSIDKNGNSIHKAFNEILNLNDYVYFSSYSSGQIFRRL